MLLSEFQQLVFDVLPSSTAMVGDPIGTHIESEKSTANKILICLEITDGVVAEALDLGCDCILTYHPLIYSPLVSVTLADRVGRLVTKLVKNDVSVVSVHTSFDAHAKGTNTLLASNLGLHVEGPLNSNNGGIGLVATTDTPMLFADFVELVQNVCGSPARFVESPSGVVERIAIVCGSGMSFFSEAIASGADTFLTADVKYHGFLAAQGEIGIVDPGHFEMEQFVPAGLHELLKSKLVDRTELIVSSVVTNPIGYMPTLSAEYQKLHAGTA